MKGYHSDRVTQSFETVTSRRNLIRAALIGIPALALASVSASALQDDVPASESATSKDIPLVADRGGRTGNHDQPEIVADAIRRVVDAVRDPSSGRSEVAL